VKNSSWIALVTAGLLASGGAGCSDDSDATPDSGGDDGGLDTTPADEGADDADVPDEPVGPGDYPAGPYGILEGDVIDNLHFRDIDGNLLTLADIYNDHGVKLLWIYATAGWCTVCSIESPRLVGIWNTYNPEGLQILGVVFENNTPGAPANVAFASSYAGRYHWPFPGVADEPFVMGPYFDKAATPMNMLVDLTTMEILDIEMGWEETGLVSLVQLRLSEIADRE
jgi:hypothetical protein